MATPDNVTISIPVQATYQVIDGKATRISAEYMEIGAKDFAEFLIRGFGLNPEDLLTAKEA